MISGRPPVPARTRRPTSPTVPPSRIRIRTGLLAIVLSLLTMFALSAPSVAAAPAPMAARTPNSDPYVPPSETVTPPNTDTCGQRTKPPAAVDTSEDVPPGAPAVSPLPVPATPVGAGRLGECGLIVPKGAPPLPSDISAGAWLIADLDTGEVLAAKDPHGRYRPASTLKLLTARVMLKNLREEKKIVQGITTDTEQDGTRVGIEAGGKYTVRQLLTYLIIISGNDAANALARTNGGYDKTVDDMNATARALGALDTRAATVSGLDGPGQSTSAYDLALFAKADMATPPFPDIVSSVDVRVPSAGGPGYIAANDNQLLHQYKGALGGKTGFTDDAGNTYVGMAERNGRRLVVTMLNGTQQPRRQWMQGASLLDWGFALPAGTAPVGRLVGSFAEATAAPASPTPTTGAPGASSSSPGSAGTQATGATAGPAPTTDATAATAATSGSGSTALVLAAVGVIVLVVGVVLLLLRRRSGRRSAFAGDAAPVAVAETVSAPPDASGATAEDVSSGGDNGPAGPDVPPAQPGTPPNQPDTPPTAPPP